MKNLFAILFLSVAIFGYSQSKSLNGNASFEKIHSNTHNKGVIENLNVTVTVDSAEDLEATFSVEDIRSIIKETAKNEVVSFKIICNGDSMSNGKKSHMSYKVRGNTNDINGFLKSVKKIRKSAIKYYKAK